MLKKMKLQFAVIAIASVVATPALSGTVSVKAGGKVRLDGWAHFDESCKTTGYASYTTAKDPKLGKVIEKKESWKMSTSSYKQCIGKTKSGKRAYYVAGKNKGTDRFILIRIDRRGKEKKIRMTVKIR